MSAEKVNRESSGANVCVPSSLVTDHSISFGVTSGLSLLISNDRVILNPSRVITGESVMAVTTGTAVGQMSGKNELHNKKYIAPIPSLYFSSVEFI